MNYKIKIWIKLMAIFDKYWGCHQMADRSFSFRNYQFPVCARCTGIIIGEIISIIVFILHLRLNTITCTCIMLPLIVDGTVQYRTNYISNNIKRLITGLLFGFGFMQILCILITNAILFVIS